MRREIFLFYNTVKTKITKSKIFLLCCFAFIFGVAFGAFVKAPFFYYFICFLSLIFLLIVFYKNKFWLMFFLCSLFCLLGIFRFNCNDFIRTKNVISNFNNQKILFQGIVSQDPDTRGNKAKYIMESRQIDLNGLKIIKGKVLVNADLYPTYEYGDLLEIQCKIRKPEPIEDFAYDKYLARYDIYSVCSFPKIKLVAKNKGNFVYLHIMKFRHRLKDIGDKIMKKPESSIFAAINLGLTKETPQDVLQVFANAGVSHIIAISGTNITILCGILMNFCLALGINRKKAFYLCSLAILFYVVLVGLPVSAVRAGIMGFIVLLSVRLGRMSNINNALFFTGALLVLINPKILLSDVSFQLSFLAVVSLVYFGDFFGALLEKIKIPKSFGIFESLQMTLAAQVLTMPIIIYNFGVISTISLIANILIVPVLPMLMVLGMISLFVGLLNLFVAEILIIPCYLALAYIIKTSEILTSIPYAYFTIEKKNLYFIIVYILILFLLIIFSKRKNADMFISVKQRVKGQF